MVIQPLIGNPYNGYINPYYCVDDHPLLFGNNGSDRPDRTCETTTINNKCHPSDSTFFFGAVGGHVYNQLDKPLYIRIPIKQSVFHGMSTGFSSLLRCFCSQFNFFLWSCGGCGGSTANGFGGSTGGSSGLSNCFSLFYIFNGTVHTTHRDITHPRQSPNNANYERNPFMACW